MNYYASQLNKSMKHSIVEDIRQKREPYRKFADKAQEMLKKEREKKKGKGERKRRGVGEGEKIEKGEEGRRKRKTEYEVEGGGWTEK